VKISDLIFIERVRQGIAESISLHSGLIFSLVVIQLFKYIVVARSGVFTAAVLEKSH